MNTANLQLEGLYVALAALVDTLRSKGVLTAAEIDAALKTAEAESVAGQKRKLSDANADAVYFPLRYLRAANKAAANGEKLNFYEIATEIGLTKDD